MFKTFPSIFLVLLLGILFTVKVAAWMTHPMVGPYAGMGDAQVRVMLVKAQQYEPQYGVWLPLPFQAIQFALHLYNNVELAPRLLWVGIHVILLVLLYTFTVKNVSQTAFETEHIAAAHDHTVDDRTAHSATTRITSHRKVGLIAIFLFLCSTYFATYLTFPLTEPLFAVFFLAGLLCLELPWKYLRVIAASAMFALANATRFEGWYLFPLVIGLILFRKDTTRQAPWFSTFFRRFTKGEIIFFSFLYCLYPVYWMWNNYVHTHDFLYFITEKTSYAHATKEYVWSNLHNALHWVELYFGHLGIVGVILTFFGWMQLKNNTQKNTNTFTTGLKIPASVQAYRNGKGADNKVIVYKYFALIMSMYLLVMLIAQVFVGTMEWYPDQYLYIPLLFTLPYAAVGFTTVMDVLSKWHKYFPGTVVTVIFLFSLYTDYKFFSNFPNPQTPFMEKLRTYQSSKILILQSEESAAPDSDWVMYFAKNYTYSGATFRFNDESLCAHIANQDFDLFLSYNASDEFLLHAYGCNRRCGLLLRDEGKALFHR